MRFLIDECCPRDLGAALAAPGHDVEHALDGERGLADAEHVRRAGLPGRLVVTADYDYGDLIIRDGAAAAGLVIIGPQPGSMVAASAGLAGRIHELGPALVGHLTLLEPERTRRRRLGS